MAGPVKSLGMDLVDFAIHVGVTICLLGVVGVSNGPDGLYPVITAASIITFGLRRKSALRRSTLEGSGEADRLAEVEERLGYLETLQDRVLELEERLDFAERLLAQKEPERLSSDR